MCIKSPFRTFLEENCGTGRKGLFVIYHVGHDPFKLTPLAFNILGKLQLATGTHEIMLGISASEIFIAVI